MWSPKGGAIRNGLKRTKATSKWNRKKQTRLTITSRRCVNTIRWIWFFNSSPWNGVREKKNRLIKADKRAGEKVSNGKSYSQSTEWRILKQHKGIFINQYYEFIIIMIRDENSDSPIPIIISKRTQFTECLSLFTFYQFNFKLMGKMRTSITDLYMLYFSLNFFFLCSPSIV